MTIDQFEKFVSSHPDIEWQLVKDNDGTYTQTDNVQDADGIAFRVPHLPYYGNNPNAIAFCPKSRLIQITPEQLERGIVQGLDVEQVTRITGYFSKVHAWNAGKVGELRQRRRQSIDSTEPSPAWMAEYMRAQGSVVGA